MMKCLMLFMLVSFSLGAMADECDGDLTITKKDVQIVSAVCNVPTPINPAGSGWVEVIYPGEISKVLGAYYDACKKADEYRMKNQTATITISCFTDEAILKKVK